MEMIFISLLIIIMKLCNVLFINSPLEEPMLNWINHGKLPLSSVPFVCPLKLIEIVRNLYLWLHLSRQDILLRVPRVHSKCPLPHPIDLIQSVSVTVEFNRPDTNSPGKVRPPGQGLSTPTRVCHFHVDFPISPLTSQTNRNTKLEIEFGIFTYTTWFHDSLSDPFYPGHSHKKQ